MIGIVLVTLLQVSGPAPEPQEQRAEAPAIVAPIVAATPEKPKVVCTMEPVTGTRAKKQEVCRTPGYERGADRSKDMMRQIQGGSGNVQPTLPKGIGG
jgi:predicted peroxiredoxin